SLTMLWPPLFLYAAMKNFDAIIDDHRAPARDCSVAYKLWTIGREFLFKDWPQTLSSEASACLGGIVLVDGFVNATKRSWKAHVEVTADKATEPTGFEDFFRKYRPELWNLLEHKDERLALSHWMQVIRKDSTFPVRIMTSKNDFLNRGLDWDAFKSEFKLTDEHLIVLPWGGHSGPIGMPGFSEVLHETLAR